MITASFGTHKFSAGIKGNSSVSVEINGKVISGASVPIYTGSYEVTPKIDAQTLKTANKRMEKDVAIKAIPIYQVSNNDGTTVYIARELE